MSFQGATPHRSGQADFPHPAPTLGNDAHAAQRKRMMDTRRSKPVVDQTIKHPSFTIIYAVCGL